ncbi:MAG: hypothetical protein KKG75_02030 [Nanoarchaeota archaeon]|nr:hypothetical protein [Nanoarchaeota archaeon]
MNVVVDSKENKYVKLTNPNIESLLRSQRATGRAILKCSIYTVHELESGFLEARIFTYPGRLLNIGQLEWISERISRGDNLYVPRNRAVQSGYLAQD